MAQDPKLISKMLGILAIVFICIIIILCVVSSSKESSRSRMTSDQEPKSQDREGIIPITSTTPETTTTTPKTSTTTPKTTTTTPKTTTTTPTTTTTTPKTTTTTPEITSSPPPPLPETASTTEIITTTPKTTNITDKSEDDTTNITSPTPAVTETSNITEDNTTNITSTPAVTETSNITEDGTSNITSPTPAVTETSNITEDGTSNITSPTPAVTETSNITEDGTSNITSPTPAVTETSNIDKSVESKSPAYVSQASDMLAMMNSTQKACENFYHYACGGVMSKPYIKPRQPSTTARMMIKEELERQNSNDTSTGAGKMKALYDSCLNPGSQDAKKDWVKPIKDMFGNYAFRSDTNFSFDLSEALGYMMNKGFMPFFTMKLDINPMNREAFILSIHPTVPGSRFTEDLARKVCLERHHAYLLSQDDDFSYNVAEEYDKFRKCVGSGDGLEARLVRMKDAVVRLQLMNDLNDENAKTLLHQTISNTKQFLTELSEKLPNVPDLILDLANRDFCSTDFVTDIEDTPINWKKVLMKFLNISDTNIDSYEISRYCGLDNIIKVLYEHSRSPQEMNNILLLLWAERIYTDFIEPVETSVGNPEYCLNAAIALMEDTASVLYLQAVAPDVKARDAQIDTIAKSIKLEGVRQMETYTQKEVLQEKLEDMMDNVVKLNIEEGISTSSMEQVSLNGDFLHNSLVLLAHRSTLTKKSYDNGPNDNYKVFARPYDPSGFYSYPLNRIMIPYATQEPFHTLSQLPEYLQYATVGHQISHLLWHGYDTSGKGFNKYGKGNLQDMMLPNSILKDSYIGPRNYTNHKGLTANYNMTDLTRNEIWADVKGIDLAWHAYVNRNINYEHKRSRRTANLYPSQELDLPFLNMTHEQLFYLQWAQQYCSDTSDLRMLEVMESRQPPGIERVNFVTAMSEGFKKAFQCPTIEVQG
ncbi:neprilysin-like isoform X2 [Portunus trituberculatus]|uniref:neprilysin-like isoform X2 n=1 Tax=Portunus trituberculatus TaxID=210409 RepID=UPI001E1CCCCA|nr:neprilysin-like isoform X2 [Portunus trituberculatus]